MQRHSLYENLIFPGVLFRLQCYETIYHQIQNLFYICIWLCNGASLDGIHVFSLLGKFWQQITHVFYLLGKNICHAMYSWGLQRISDVFWLAKTHAYLSIAPVNLFGHALCVIEFGRRCRRSKSYPLWLIQWNLSLTTTSLIKLVNCDLFSNVF